jgi:hypothetical protein
MIARSSRSIASLHDDFAAHVDANLLKRCNDAMAGLRSTKDEAVRAQLLRLQAALRIGEKLEIDDILRLFEQAEGLQAEIKRLSDRIPDLFQRFLYVGVTRAATYLGLTCERELPTQLEPLRPNFGAADWSDG